MAAVLIPQGMPEVCQSMARHGIALCKVNGCTDPSLRWQGKPNSRPIHSIGISQSRDKNSPLSLSLGRTPLLRVLTLITGSGRLERGMLWEPQSAQNGPPQGHSPCVGSFTKKLGQLQERCGSYLRGSMLFKRKVDKFWLVVFKRRRRYDGQNFEDKKNQ